MPILWTAPGGGFERGECAEDAARREFRKELGSKNPMLSPCIWLRQLVFPMGGLLYWQIEWVHLCEVEPFEPPPAVPEALVQEHVLELRWWTMDELRNAGRAVFAPRRLPHLKEWLLAEGPPREPTDTGV